MDEQMIADIAKALHRSEAELFGYVGKDDLVDGLWWNNERRYLREARAAHSVIAGKVAELTWLLKGREAAMRWVYENGMVPDHDRPKWVSEQFSDAYADKRAALAPYPERRSE